MRNKTSIGVVEAPVVVVVSWLFVSCEIVSFGSSQVQVWNESLSHLFSVLQQHVNTVVVSHEICYSSRVCIHLFVRFVYPVVCLYEKIYFVGFHLLGRNWFPRGIRGVVGILSSWGVCWLPNEPILSIRGMWTWPFQWRDRWLWANPKVSLDYLTTNCEPQLERWIPICMSCLPLPNCFGTSFSIWGIEFHAWGLQQLRRILCEGWGSSMFRRIFWLLWQLRSSIDSWGLRRYRSNQWPCLNCNWHKRGQFFLPNRVHRKWPWKFGVHTWILRHHLNVRLKITGHFFPVEFCSVIGGTKVSWVKNPNISFI